MHSDYLKLTIILLVVVSTGCQTQVVSQSQRVPSNDQLGSENLKIHLPTTVYFQNRSFPLALSFDVPRLNDINQADSFLTFETTIEREQGQSEFESGVYSEDGQWLPTSPRESSFDEQNFYRLHNSYSRTRTIWDLEIEAQDDPRTEFRGALYFSSSMTVEPSPMYATFLNPTRVSYVCQYAVEGKVFYDEEPIQHFLIPSQPISCD